MSQFISMLLHVVDVCEIMIIYIIITNITFYYFYWIFSYKLKQQIYIYVSYNIVK